MTGILLCMAVFFQVGQSTSLPRADVDPAAKKALAAMVKTYATIRHLNQETTYSAGDDRLPPFVRTRLLVSRPNRLLLEMFQPAPGAEKPVRLLYQSDGKHFYSYQEAFSRYVKEKAPKSFADMQHMAVSIELAAITGLDPVAPLLERTRTVTMESGALSDGTATDIVTFDMSTRERSSNLRLTIGRQDHLVRRFDLRIVPVPIAEPKDAGVTDDPNSPPPPARRREEPTQLSYENQVSRDLPKDAFVWIAPQGAFESREYPTLLNPTAGTGSLAGQGGLLPPGLKPMKIIKYEDLMKQAWKKKK